MNLNENFNQKEFIAWVEGFLPEFNSDVRKVDVPQSFSDVLTISTLGESLIGVRVYIIETNADPSKRKVGLATDSFSLLKNYASPNAIIAYYSKNSSLWRISLLTSTPIWSEGKIITKLSNPKRQSYVLGKNAKVKTPHQYLLSKGKVADFNDLKTRFSLEVVNKEFYKEISLAFTQLVGGTVTNGRSKKSYEAQLKLPYIKDHSQTSLEFSVRLIGRVIFCWFLREKRSNAGHSLMPKELLSYDAIKTIEDYYHKILEPIFFEILNKPENSRKSSYINELFSAIPYLNGGLFSPHEDDFFNYNEGKQAVNHNLVLIPDKWIQSFFEVLETYNFTIDENTSFDEELSIDPEMLGRIFENLLAEINPETGESARKSTGSYYTPRVIVDYMIDESLFLYLKEKTNIEEVKLRSLISHDFDDDISNPLTDDQKTKITEALGKVKILDPACGSGAFPIGALQKIVFILQQIDQTGQLWFKKQIENTPIELRKVIEREFKEKNFDYIRKLGIIRENIYGVDIQPIATEISRLRCFLTLVVDERIDDSLENRGIEPLPNLDFKFVTANTLVGLPTSKSSGLIIQVGLFEDNEGINELKEVRDMFFNASGFERDQLKLQFSQTQNKMLHKLIDESRRGHADMTSKLTSWDPFSHKVSSWFDPEWMFGIKEGFDITIANPPYFQIQKMTDSLKTEIEKSYNTYTKIGDLYCLFYEKSISLLKEKGISCFITSNSWLRTKYGSLLRKYLLINSNPLRLINFEDAQLFSSAVVETNILITQKFQWQKNLAATIVDQSLHSYQSLTDYVNKNNVFLNNLDESGWTIGNNATLNLKKKIEKSSTLLKDLEYNINFGIKTGFNTAFIINESTKDEICSVDPNSIEIIKPLLRGRDITKWGYEFDNKWLINSHNGIRSKHIQRIDVEKDYPAIYEHLVKYKKELIKRQDKGEHWSNLRNCAYLEDFSKEKILWGELSDKPKFTLDQNGYFAEATLFVMTGDNLKYILGILNSSLSNWYFNLISTSSGMGTNRWKKYKIETFPIHNCNDSTRRLLSDLVEQILSTESDEIKIELENHLNSVVYKIYELTTDEIKIIEEYKNA